MDHNHTLAPEELSCLRGCRTYEQYVEMRERFEKKECPFCILNRTLNEVEHEDEHWYGWNNPYLRRGLAVQGMIVPKRHVRSPHELDPREMLDFRDALEWAEKRYQLSKTGGMIFCRFGDMRLNAGTVPHLHFNVWIPDQTDEVRIPIFKRPEDAKENEERMAEFERMYASGVRA